MTNIKTGQRLPGEAFHDRREYWLDPERFGRVILPKEVKLFDLAESSVRSSTAANYATPVDQANEPSLQFTE